MTESAKARQAWADYLALGPGRSLEQLCARYHGRAESVPTRQLSRLKAWSAAFGWQARLQAVADQEAAAALAREAAYRRDVLETGYALAHERVALLKRLAAKLEAELLEDGRLWVTEPKSVGSGPLAQVVDLERFNAPEVEALRGVLSDIAAEKSERAKAVKVDLEPRLRRMAEQLGLDPDEAVAEALAVLRETQGGPLAAES